MSKKVRKIISSVIIFLLIGAMILPLITVVL